MRNIILISLELGETFAAAAASRLIADCTITAFPANQQDMQVRVDGDDQHVADWSAGVGVMFEQIDLARLEFKGAAGDKVLIAGTSAP
ncbi:MAG: hypothetical protein DCC67_07545 [Planctomycetota bacterium]|nr:MAG: hypothetical protein DCC67_07545 [Planctomycetota bacterium]